MNSKHQNDLQPKLAKGCSHCEEYDRLSRRGFLTGAAGVATAATATWAGAVPRLTMGGAGRDVLVNVFFRGALDGLSTVVPYADNELYVQRPNLAIQPPGQTDGAIDLDGFFGLAPSAAPLLTPWNDNNLLFVHASGNPNNNRSHFLKQDIWERGTDSQTDLDPSGWLARHLQTTPAATPGAPMRAMVTDAFVVKALALAPNTLAISDPAQFTMYATPPYDVARLDRLEKMYSHEKPPMGAAAVNTFDTITLLDTIDFANYIPSNGAVYPGGPFGTKLMQTAAIIKADIGLEIAEIDIGGWDLHEGLGPISGAMAANLAQISAAFEAFYLDMGTGMDNVVLLGQTEFGRRIEENSSAGTDHGHGSIMILMGGNVNGGQVFTNGPWPGLINPTSLGDLEVTTDYRDVLSEILTKRMANTNLQAVFPGYSPQDHSLLT